MIPFLATGLLAVALQPDTGPQASKLLVYLDSVQVPNLKKGCLSPLSKRFAAEVRGTKGVEAARYRSEADFVAVVQECTLADAFHGHVSAYGGREGTETGSVTTASVDLAAPLGAKGRVVLAVEVDGKPREFASGPVTLPFDEAVRVATRSLLDWIQAQPRP